MKHCTRLRVVPDPLDQREHELKAAARDAGLVLRHDRLALRAGRPHILLTRRERIVATFRRCADGLAWVEAQVMGKEPTCQG